MTLLARLIAKEEGFGIPGKIPTTHHNPGDLRHSPHSTHSISAPDAIGQIDNDVDGWADLERQLRLYATPQRKRIIAPDRSLTLREMIVNYYAPSTENDSERYLRDVCNGGGWTPATLVSEALATP